MHYHSISPCMVKGSKTTKPGLCSDDANCSGTGKITSFMVKGWPKTNYGGSVGIARDGHVIYGPYNGDGELWSCADHDVCNGFFLADGSYGYAATTTFPWIVGCWGPGP